MSQPGELPSWKSDFSETTAAKRSGCLTIQQVSFSYPLQLLRSLSEGLVYKRKRKTILSLSKFRLAGESTGETSFLGKCNSSKDLVCYSQDPSILLQMQ